MDKQLCDPVPVSDGARDDADGWVAGKLIAKRGRMPRVRLDEDGLFKTELAEHGHFLGAMRPHVHHAPSWQVVRQRAKQRLHVRDVIVGGDEAGPGVVNLDWPG
jgi:hypothetical protein